MLVSGTAVETLDEVDVEQAAVRDIVERVSASGKIQPETEVNITAEVSGQILALPVKEGDRVEKATYSSRSTPIWRSGAEPGASCGQQCAVQLASAKAQHAQANAQFFAAEKNWQRTQQLFGTRWFRKRITMPAKPTSSAPKRP